MTVSRLCLFLMTFDIFEEGWSCFWFFFSTGIWTETSRLLGSALPLEPLCQPFYVLDIFEIGSWELFARASFELQSSWVARITAVMYFIECPSAWIYLMFFSWLGCGYGFLEGRTQSGSDVLIKSHHGYITLLDVSLKSSGSHSVGVVSPP
jgi:hypothetical protein